MAQLYVILSRTTTGAGKMIRTFTRNYYNHASITLNEDLSGIVSFARLHIDVPMHAGYVAEPVERFLYKGGPIPIRVFRVEIPEEKAQRLSEFFTLAGNPDTGLLYNYFGAFLTMFHVRCRVPGAYTCLSFVSAVLDKPYRTFQEMERDLAPYEVFCGDFFEKQQDSGLRTDPFFTRRGFFGGIKDSVVHMARLVARSTHIRKFDDPVLKLK